MDVSDNLWDNDMLCAGYKIEKIRRTQNYFWIKYIFKFATNFESHKKCWGLIEPLSFQFCYQQWKCWKVLQVSLTPPDI